MPTTVPSPFGGSASQIARMSTKKIISMYRSKCGADISRSFAGIDEITLHECDTTHMLFWRPASIAGDEQFYKTLSGAWPEYYRSDRWEYDIARNAIAPGSRVLEIGCGRGYFLASLETKIDIAIGLEMNREAIANKVTRFEVRNLMLEKMADAEPASFDAVCSFQVLEHVPDPASFIKDGMRCLRPGGLLILSTPNYEFDAHRHRRDAFDLPPHHINHFEPSTYDHLARLYGLEVVATEKSMTAGPTRFVLNDNTGSALTRLVKGKVNALRRWSSGNKQVPSHTLIAVLKKAIDPA